MRRSHLYAILQSLIQLFLTLTKLRHIERGHPENAYLSQRIYRKLLLFDTKQRVKNTNYCDITVSETANKIQSKYFLKYILKVHIFFLVS